MRRGMGKGAIPMRFMKLQFEELQADYLETQFVRRDEIVSDGLSMIEALMTSGIPPSFLQKISSDVFDGIRHRLAEHETEIRHALMVREPMEDALQAYPNSVSEPEEGPF